jgi:phosphomannomutase
VNAFVDLEKQTRRSADGSETKLSYPPSDVLIFELDGGHRIMARPSGTEPKIKFYFDARVEVGEHEETTTAQARGEALLAQMLAAFSMITGT